MKTLNIIILAAALLFSAGCMNTYVRFPTTNPKIESTYQCTRATAALSIVVMFPQIMSDVPNQTFMAENLLTIPLGCVVLVDSVCEGVIDTVCWPADYFIADARNPKKEARQFLKEENIVTE